MRSLGDMEGIGAAASDGPTSPNFGESWAEGKQLYPPSGLLAASCARSRATFAAWRMRSWADFDLRPAERGNYPGKSDDPTPFDTFRSLRSSAEVSSNAGEPQR